MSTTFTISEFKNHFNHEIIFTNSERGKYMYFENDTDLYRVIGANIKHYREQQNLTQVQLAEQAKISLSYISKIEASGCNKSLSIANAVNPRFINKEMCECRNPWTLILFTPASFAPLSIS